MVILRRWGMPDRFIVTQQASLSHKPSYLRALARNALHEVADALEEVADMAIAEAQDNYNSADEGETYERTFDMFNRWEAHPAVDLGNEISVTITNDVIERDRPWRHYAALVQGDQQTFRHQNAGWRTIRDILNDLSHIQAAKVREAIRRAGRAI